MMPTRASFPLLMSLGLSIPAPQVTIRLDAELADIAMSYLGSGDPALLRRMASTPAAAHLLAHARAWEYGVPRSSTAALVASLVTPRDDKACRLADAARVRGAFLALEADPSWVAEVRRALPRDATMRISLYLTFGYDIGVAGPGTASLNAAHPHFGADPRELRYYAIHECHHAAFMTYQTPRPLAGWQSAGDLLAQAEYALQLEGMAVWAAWDLREREGALEGDADYRALQDPALVQALEATYLKAHRALELRAARSDLVDDATRALLLDLYGPERVFYRFWAHAAREIARHRGREALVDLVKAGPRAFLRAYLACPRCP